MKITLRNYDTGEVINSFSFPETGSKFSLSSSIDNALNAISKMQKTEDVLHMGQTGQISPAFCYHLGVKSYCMSGARFSTNSEELDKKDIYERDENSIRSGNITATAEKEPDEIRMYVGENYSTLYDSGLKISFNGYREGLCLMMGKEKESGILGLGPKKPLMLKKINPTTIVSGFNDDCKVWDSPNKMLKYIQDKADVLKYTVGRYRNQYSVTYITEEYKKDIEALPEKKKQKWDETMKALNQLLDEINSSDVIETEETEKIPIPEVLTEEAMKAEAVARMKRLNLMDEVVKRFQIAGEVMKSEFMGILYDLDEDAKTAVAEAKERGLLPYHVILSHTEFGDMYDVLYVSTDLSYWEYERYDERDNNIIPSMNMSGMGIEFGDIEVEPKNGGVQRIG